MLVILNLFCCIIKIMDELSPNLYFSTCIFTERSSVFTQKYQYSRNW